jgi:hypothetical protein
MGSCERISSNEAPQTNAHIFLVTAPHLPIHKSPQTISPNEQDFSLRFLVNPFARVACALRRKVVYRYKIRCLCASRSQKLCGSFAIFCMGSSLGSLRGSLSSFATFGFFPHFGSFRSADLVLFFRKESFGGSWFFSLT